MLIYDIIKVYSMLKNKQNSSGGKNMKKISAREIVYSAGMSDEPEYYSGRGATTSDLDGDILYNIYIQIKEKLGTNQANEFVTMVENLKELSATNFLNALYFLERNNWKYKQFRESKIDLGCDRPGREAIAFATIAEALFQTRYSRPDQTEYIKREFFRKIA